MLQHIFLPTVDLEKVTLLAEHEAYLTTWLQGVEDDVERGDVAASTCLQGVIAEQLLHGRIITDWIGVMEAHLTRDGKPLAYSERYGNRLYNFAFWMQSEVHAIYTRWWIERTCNTTSSLDFADLIENLIQPSGWIYNPQVSPTGIRTRMKSEYFMSLAMGIELLNQGNRLKNRRTDFEGLLSDQPLTGYLSAEYFRSYALELMGDVTLVPVTIPQVLTSCEVGQGYCDFDVNSKIDDYMGTAKRTSRDIPVHSALSALHASFLAPLCADEIQARVAVRLKQFGEHIRNEPMDIQAFRMREIDTPFGTGLTPLEIIAASGIVSSL